MLSFVARELLIESASSKRGLFEEYLPKKKNFLVISNVKKTRKIGKSSETCKIFDKTLLLQKVEVALFIKINLQLLAYVNKGWESDNSTGWVFGEKFQLTMEKIKTKSRIS